MLVTRANFRTITVRSTDNKDIFLYTAGVRVILVIAIMSFFRMRSSSFYQSHEYAGIDVRGDERTVTPTVDRELFYCYY